LEDSFIVHGADIDPSAYGLSDSRFEKTHIIKNKDDNGYCQNLITICKHEKIDFIAPGAEATNRILCRNQDMFKNNNIFPLVNSQTVFDVCSNKVKCNNFLASNGLPSVESIFVSKDSKLDSFAKFPCVVKPSSDSGGSNMVFLAENLQEAQFFVSYLAARGLEACVQEYIVSTEEFTVGVLSAPDGTVISSIALRRNLNSKLSRSLSYGNRVLSSGWSQGRIEAFPFICKQAEEIASALGSTWALNIQGRVRNSEFIPFEINPRHSGTSYFRALSGVNEIIIGLEYLKSNNIKAIQSRTEIRPATYSRILTERVVFDGDVCQ